MSASLVRTHRNKNPARRMRWGKFGAPLINSGRRAIQAGSVRAFGTRLYLNSKWRWLIGHAMVAEIEYRGLTPAGELWHPVIRGWHAG
jgi:hypothetical protein